MDISALRAYAAENRRSVVGFPKVSAISNAELLTLRCDILIPAALENQVTEENAHEVRAQIIAETANGMMTLEANQILEAQCVTVLTDPTEILLSTINS